MRTEDAAKGDLARLRQFVSKTLCQQHDIEEDTFQVTERWLIQKGERCGIFFCLHGPRSVKLTAVWESKSNTVLFYGSTGERVKKAAFQAVI
jgi:hypothetical protein